MTSKPNRKRSDVIFVSAQSAGFWKHELEIAFILHCNRAFNRTHPAFSISQL